jgi:hypothetical protein
LLIKRDGRTVAGGLCRAQGEKVRFIYLGIANADRRLMKEHVIGALYISRLHWANQAGYQVADFLGCPPFMDMGVFQYKRKWGTTISTPSRLHKQIWFRFQRDTPAVRQFLKDNPCVTVDEKGDLHGLVLVDEAPVTPEMEAQYHKRYFTPGMKSLLISPVTDLLQGLEGATHLSALHLVAPEERVEH